MKYVKLFESFLLENMDIDGIYHKYYSDILYDDYIKIVEADPTYKPNKRTKGLYMKWLLILYKQGNLKIEDLYKATNYLKIYIQYKHQIDFDIDNVNSLSQLFSLVEPFDDKEDGIFTNEEEKMLYGQFEQVYKDDKWRIIIPLTLKASKYFGQNTQWCTTNTNQFEHYTEQQTKEVTPYNLYILIPMDGIMEDRLQFHFDSKQFMDIKDKQIDINMFFLNNKPMYNFFNTKFPVFRYINLYVFYKYDDRLSSNEKEAIKFINTLLSKLTLIKNPQYSKTDIYINTHDDNKVYIENRKTGDLWCRWADFWRDLEVDYHLKYYEVQALIKNVAEQFFNIKDIVPYY